MPNQTDLRRGGFYWVQNKPYLSVTECLKIINKPALQYWFGREVYRAMVIDPSLDERSALAAPYQVSSNAKSRGTTVHSIVEAFKQRGTVLEGISPEFQGYATAFYQFMKDHGVEIIEQEKTIFNDEHQIAGTLDMLNKIGESIHVTDVKTGKDIYPEARLQNSAYAFMLRAMGVKVDEISILLLETGDDGKPTGKYKFQTVEEDMNAFLAVKTLYCWNDKEKLIKLGYLK